MPIVGALLVILALWLVSAGAPAAAAEGTATPEGIHKIQHVVMIMQENHSFDSYFGTYPGANGIPAGVCLPDPTLGHCRRPYNDPSATNAGGPHGTRSAIGDIDEGKMDGFVRTEEQHALSCKSVNPACVPCPGAQTATERAECVDVMGYRDARQIPNYWEYAHHFVLQDNMFEPVIAWSLTSHLAQVSAWSAVCPHGDTNPLECVATLKPIIPALWWGGPITPLKATYAWTDVTYLLAKANVSWRYYVFAGDEPDCQVDEETSCEKVQQDFQTPGIWNPLPAFTDVQEDHQVSDVVPFTNFAKEVGQSGSCGLSHVSWLSPSQEVGEHPPALIKTGQAYVTTVVNEIMRSPCWSSTAIFISWDDWGGFYDHVQPPVIDELGYGLRVPGLVISPYAKPGYIDPQQLSTDAYLKFIEDDFLGGARLNPKTDGRPDKRKVVREEAPGLGNLVNDFNFEQQPRQALLLSPSPSPGPPSEPPGGVPNPPFVGTRRVTQMTSHSAMLSAGVVPEQQSVSDCHFEYGTSTSFGSKVPCAPSPGSGAYPVPVTGAIEGLSPGTTYFYRPVATTKAGTSYGRVLRFTIPKTLTAAAPSEATPTTSEATPLIGEPTPAAPEEASAAASPSLLEGEALDPEGEPLPSSG